MYLHDKSPALKTVRDFCENEKGAAGGGLSLDNCIKNIRAVKSS
jgi:hypothetical protein